MGVRIYDFPAVETVCSYAGPVTAVLRRVEVVGGFLHDLDIEFVPGLNVIIGPRGAGKTSVLELLRYAFDVRAITPEAESRARQHALDVLVDGMVSAVVANDDHGTTTVSRDAHSSSMAAAPPTGLRPLIVSQREIEDIGLNAMSRLQILDGLVGADDVGEEARLLDRIANVTRDIDRLLETIDTLSSRSLELAPVVADLVQVEEEASALGATSVQISEAQQKLQGLSNRLEEISAASAATEASLHLVKVLADRVAAADEHAAAISGLGDTDPVQPHIVRAARLLEEAKAEIAVGVRLLEGRFGSEESSVAEVRRELRDETQKLEALQTGAGDLARRLTRLREQEAERRQADERAAVVRAELSVLQASRDDVLDQLDELRARRFERRKSAVELVGQLFNGEIDVRLTKNGLFREYETALATALEGSGLQYKALARQLASRLSPRELVEAVEASDSAKIAELGQITAERADRLVGHLRANGTTGILTAPLEDAVDYALLDGQQYKTTSELSTGQRCTVVLPLLLAQQARLTILDQPEDHLDNAFIVDTLVRAVLARQAGAQLIIATHNANIPVLGEADQVIVMGSDGRQGGVEHRGPLEKPEIVQAVTSIMEGGAEAFQRRARFYADH